MKKIAGVLLITLMGVFAFASEDKPKFSSPPIYKAKTLIDIVYSTADKTKPLVVLELLGKQAQQDGLEHCLAVGEASAMVPQEIFNIRVNKILCADGLYKLEDAYAFGSGDTSLNKAEVKYPTEYLKKVVNVCAKSKERSSDVFNTCENIAMAASPIMRIESGRDFEVFIMHGR